MKKVSARTMVREINKKKAEIKKRMKGASAAKKKHLTRHLKKLNSLSPIAVQFFVV